MQATRARFGPVSGLRTTAKNGNERAFVDMYYAVPEKVNGASHAYVLTCTSTVPEDDQRAVPLFERIVSSFEFIDATYRESEMTRRYSHLQHGVSIDYLAELVVQENQMNATVSFVAPDETGAFASHVSYVCSPCADMSLGDDLDEFSATIRKQLESFIQGCEVREAGVATLGGVEARKLLYSGTVQHFDVTFVQLFSIRDKKAHILSFAAQSRTFERDLQRYKVCFDSFTFHDVPRSSARAESGVLTAATASSK